MAAWPGWPERGRRGWLQTGPPPRAATTGGAEPCICQAQEQGGAQGLRGHAQRHDGLAVMAVRGLPRRQGQGQKGQDLHQSHPSETRAPPGDQQRRSRARSVRTAPPLDLDGQHRRRARANHRKRKKPGSGMDWWTAAGRAAVRSLRAALGRTIGGCRRPCGCVPAAEAQVDIGIVAGVAAGGRACRPPAGPPRAERLTTRRPF